jgi:hypothetical protein
MGKSLSLTFHSERKRMSPPVRTRTATSLLRFVTSVALIAACAWGTSARATAVETSQGYVTAYFAGWRSATVRIQMDITFQNPDGCTMTDGYITDPADPGNQLYMSSLMTAFATHKKVSLVIEGCYLNRPQIIGVYVWS